MMDVLHTVRDEYGKEIVFYQTEIEYWEGRAAARQLRTPSSSHTVLHEELERRYVRIIAVNDVCRAELKIRRISLFGPKP